MARRGKRNQFEIISPGDSTNGRAFGELCRLLERLTRQPSARIRRRPGGGYDIVDASGASSVPGGIVRALAASGLVTSAHGEFLAGDEAQAWLRRQAYAARPFVAQHHHIEAATPAETEGRHVLINRDESPVGSLARRTSRTGIPWLAPQLVTAADRLRRDFEIGALQPRVTANWSASVNMDRRSGGSGGLSDLTDMALAARLRVDRAIEAVGPELSGVLIDVCCFLKGLETIERERQWPARSAKLVLRFALEALARHYGLTETAIGRTGRGTLRHWGAAGYRPEIA